jgi:hypothetical protein
MPDYRHPLGYEPSTILTRALVQAGIISEFPELDDLAGFREAIYEIASEGPAASVIERVSDRILEMLHYQSSRGHRRVRRSGYSEFFIRFLYEVAERHGDRRSLEWAKQVLEALSYLQ